MEEFDHIVTSDLPEAEKLAQAFAWITGRIETNTQQEIELAQAMNDQETLIKAQIKLSTVRHTREILYFCQQRIRAQQEQAA